MSAGNLIIGTISAVCQSEIMTFWVCGVVVMLCFCLVNRIVRR